VIVRTAITFTATIASTNGGAVSGTVTFKDGATTLGTAAVNASTRKATFATSSLNGGSHSITAVYSGNANNNGSTSPKLTQTVNKAATATTVASSLNPSTHGKAVTFTATVTPTSGGAISGTVNFKDGAALLGPVTLNASTHKATFTTSALAVGTHAITAQYAGSANFTPSASPALSQSVK
jgi:hypothetical protein